MSFPEAFKGAQVELSACKSNRERIATLFRIARVLTAEAGGALFMVPYGYRALQLYRSLPGQGTKLESPWPGVRIARDVRYGTQDRTVMDVYMPHVPEHASSRGHGPHLIDDSAVRHGPNSPAGYPVALFCHGGVWATGERWHYAPMATRLAQCGILTCVVSYTLYPQAKARDMVAELSQALTWTLDNINTFGGDPKQAGLVAYEVSALGHSAGAHMWAMVLIGRARAARKKPLHNMHANSGIADDKKQDHRMPARFIGMAGVYDTAQHLQYEAGRGVRYLSTMERALEGESRFASQSPSVILAHAAGAKSGASSAAPPRGLEHLGQAAAQMSGPAGGGVAIAPSATASAAVQEAIASQRLQQSRSIAPKDLDFTLEDASRLPRWHLYSCKGDITVPWVQSSRMEQSLQACGVPVQHRVYEAPDVSHASFVIDWTPLPAGQLSTPQHATADDALNKGPQRSLGSMQGLPAFAQDVVRGIKQLM